MCIRDSGDPRERHFGLSHHTRNVLRLLSPPVSVPVPAGVTTESDRQLRDELGIHDGVDIEVDEVMKRFPDSELPSSTMGRSLTEDEDFFLGAVGAGLLLHSKMEERA